jgi:hypothetical protein
MNTMKPTHDEIAALDQKAVLGEIDETLKRLGFVNVPSPVNPARRSGRMAFFHDGLYIVYEGKPFRTFRCRELMAEQPSIHFGLQNGTGGYGFTVFLAETEIVRGLETATHILQEVSAPGLAPRELAQRQRTAWTRKARGDVFRQLKSRFEELLRPVYAYGELPYSDEIPGEVALTA